MPLGVESDYRNVARSCNVVIELPQAYSHLELMHHHFAAISFKRLEIVELPIVNILSEMCKLGLKDSPLFKKGGDNLTFSL